MVLNYILVGCPCLVLPLTQQKSYCANSVPELLWKYILYKYLVFWWGRFLIPFFQSKSSIFTRMFHVHTKCRIQHLKTRKDTKIIVLRKKALNFCTDWNFCTTISSTYEHDRHISQSVKQIEFSNLHQHTDYFLFPSKVPKQWNLRYSKVVKYVH